MLQYVRVSKIGVSIGIIGVNLNRLFEVVDAYAYLPLVFLL